MKNTTTKMQRFLRSFASKRRIDILLLIEKENNLSIREISKKLRTGEQNISLHTFKLLNAGLIAKMQLKNKVVHTLTSRGKFILAFIKNIDRRL